MLDSTEMARYTRAIRKRANLMKTNTYVKKHKLGERMLRLEAIPNPHYLIRLVPA